MASRDDILRLKLDVDGKKANQELDKFSGKVKGAASKSETSIASMRSAFAKATIAVGALTAAGFALDKFFQQAELVSSVSRGFETLTTRVGEASDLFLNEMRQASRGFVSDVELMRQANNALILGLPVTAKTMGELTENAVKLGRALGVDATRAIESIITGIGRQSRLMLDNIGIIVKVEEANRSYARTLGISVSQMDDAQKKQAFFNATVEAAQVAVKGLTDDVDLASDGWNRFKTSVVNARDELFDFLNKLEGKRSRIREALTASGIMGLSLDQMEEFRRTNQASVLQLAGAGRLGELGEAPESRETIGGAAFATREHGQEVVELERNLSEIPARYAEIATGIRAAAEAQAYLNELIAPVGGFTEGVVDETGMPLLDLIPPPDVMQERTQSYVDGMNAIADANENANFQTDLLAGSMFAAANAMWQMGQAGKFSAKALLNAVASQVFGTLTAKAIESVVLGMQQLAFAAIPFNAAAPQHLVAAKMFFATAAKAGVGAGAALAVGAATRAGGGGGPSGGGAADRSQGIRSPAAANAPFIQEVHIFLEGQGFIQDPDSFARYLSERIKEQGSRAGA